MSTGDPILDSLDFDPTPPTCECLGGCYHHVGRCPHVAQFQTTVHGLGFCKQPGLTAEGGAVHLVCAACMNAHALKVTQLVQASQNALLRIGKYLSCGSCGRDITEPTDLWEVRALHD